MVDEKIDMNKLGELVFANVEECRDETASEDEVKVYEFIHGVSYGISCMNYVASSMEEAKRMYIEDGLNDILGGLEILWCDGVMHLEERYLTGDVTKIVEQPIRPGRQSNYWYLE